MQTSGMGHDKGTGQGLMRGQAALDGEAYRAYRSLGLRCLAGKQIGVVIGTARGEAPASSASYLYTSLKTLVRAHYRLWLFPAVAIKSLIIPAIYKLASRLDGLSSPQSIQHNSPQRTAKYA